MFDKNAYMLDLIGSFVPEAREILFSWYSCRKVEVVFKDAEGTFGFLEIWGDPEECVNCCESDVSRDSDLGRLLETIPVGARKNFGLDES